MSGSYDTVVKVWDVRSTKTPLFDMQKHNEKVISTFFAQFLKNIGPGIGLVAECEFGGVWRCRSEDSYI